MDVFILPSQIKATQRIKDESLFGQIMRVRMEQCCQWLERNLQGQTEKWVKEYGDDMRRE